MADEGGVRCEDAQEAAGVDELGGVAVGYAEGERTEETSVGRCEESVGDGSGVCEGRCVDVVDDGVDDFLGEGGNHGWIEWHCHRA